MINENVLVILIAPNVGEQMGGEAIKALQIFRELKKQHSNTIQITHERNKRELSDRLRVSDVYYVPDTAIALILWHSHVLRWFLNPWFCYKATRLAEKIASARQLNGQRVIIHQTEPNSPVMPRIISKKHPTVFGPINGNIYFPRIFRRYETVPARLRRMFHTTAQRVNRLLFRGITQAKLILAAGGMRTRMSLLIAGCKESIIVETLDCGISDSILDRPRVQHSGINYRFVHFGRLVFHKGTFLIIKSLAKTKYPICLDIVGRGPELTRCQRLSEELGLGGRIRFLDWFESHSELLDSLAKYRGALLPSFEDANGIVVQEAMAMGLVTICLDWGGPQLLIKNGISGYLIKPLSEDHIVSEMAALLDRLATDNDLADRLSLEGRRSAEGWRWSKVIANWLSLYSSRVLG
jgi:glycosyltransferase involved in cell wall biosynthesis